MQRSVWAAAVIVLGGGLAVGVMPLKLVPMPFVPRKREMRWISAHAIRHAMRQVRGWPAQPVRCIWSRSIPLFIHDR